MKKLALIVSLLAIMPGTVTFAKEEKAPVEVVAKNANGSYSYENVVNVENVAKEEMFKRAQQWVLSNLKTGDNNIGFNEGNQTINNTATIVLAAGRGLNWAITHAVVNFKIQLEFREGRYKFIFNNIVVQAAYADGIVETMAYETITRNNKPARHIKKEVNEKLSVLASSLAAAVKGGKTANDNW